MSGDVCDNWSLDLSKENNAMHLTVPTMLTLLRIALVPVLVVVFFLPYSWTNVACVIIFVAAAVTDIADGAIARSTGQTSRFGAFLDPVADKIMVSTALVLLVAQYSDPAEVVAHPAVFAIAAAIIIGREITISALREWMSEIGESARVQVSGIGKLKTIFQMTAIGFLLYREDLLFLPVSLIGELLLYTAAALTLWSMWSYLKSAWPAISPGRGNSSE